MAANDDIRSASISHAIGISRLTSGTVKKMIALLSASDADLVMQIIESNPTSKARLAALLKSVREINAKAYAALSDSLGAELDDLAVYEAEFNDRLIVGSIPVTIATTIPAKEALLAAVNSRPFQGKLLKEWLAEAGEASARRVRDAIRIGVVEGESINTIAQRVRGTAALNYTDGILDISKRGAAALVRTAVNHTVSAARQVWYEENADIIKGVQWISTLDGRTSAVCRSRDGEVYPVDSGPRPPAHIACRSSTAPVMKSLRELGIDADDVPKSTRASMNGQVPETETYQSWLKKQPAGFQDEVLGKTKGQLFRNGGLTLDKFVDKNGLEYNLDQLRKREAQAFAAIQGN